MDPTQQPSHSQPISSVPTSSQGVSPKNSRKFYGFLLAIILVFFLASAVVAAFVVQSRNKVKLEKQAAQAKLEKSLGKTGDKTFTTSVTPIKGWKTATSSFCKISLQYPPSWKLWRLDHDGCEIALSTSDEKRIGMSVFGFPRGSMFTFSSWDDVLKANPNAKKVTIAGIEGIEGSTRAPHIADIDVSLSKRYFYFPKGSAIFNINYFFDPSASDSAETIALFDRVRDSLVFTGDPENNFLSVDVKTPSGNINNTRRGEDIFAIQIAILKYASDNNGELPTEIGVRAQEISSSGADICSLLVPKYMKSLPVDPLTNKGLSVTSCSSPYNTNYQIIKDQLNQVIISAPAAELGKTISIQDKVHSDGRRTAF